MTLLARRCVAELLPVPAVAAPGRDALVGARVVVLGGSCGQRESVLAAVGRCGAHTVDVDDAAGPAEIAAQVAGVDIVVDLNLTGTSEVRPGLWADPLERTYTVLRTLAGDWAREDRADRCFYVALTAGGGRLGTEATAVRQPLSGIWAGLAKTLPRELPACNVRVIDLAEDIDPGAAAVAEVCGGRFVEVGWCDGRRHVLVPRPRRLDPAHTVDISPGSVVVVTGGGRGIGYHLARRLRSGWGCQVVVTGRQDLPVGDEAVYASDDDTFQQLVRRRLQGCRGSAQIRAARLELQRLGRARQLWRNLTDARRAGADLVYQRCDVTDLAQVRSLLDGLDAPLAALVHDAGIDRPARLSNKGADDVRAVVSTKVDGFLHVLTAASDRPVGVLCAVGSLTGRFGGTAGQTDYAGANEGLARLADWSRPRGVDPVTCLSWPTWDALGLITNAEAAVREMSAIPVDVGVAAWEQELRAPYAGEVLYLGEVGALTPAQLRGLPVPSDYEGAGRLAQRRHLLGELVRWTPGVALETRHRLDVATLPAASGFLVDGRPSVPVSILLELALDAASWLQPTPVTRPPLSLRQLRVHVGSLPLGADGTVILCRRARTARHGDAWRVEVTFDAAGRLATSVTVTAGRDDELPTLRPDVPQAPAPAVLPDAARPGVAWSAAAGVMSATGRGDWRRLRAEPRRASDLSTRLHAPEPALPAGVLEAMLWASCPADARSTWTLEVDEIRRGPGDVARCSSAVLDAATGTASARADDGAAVLHVTGLRWLAPGDPR